MNVEVLVNPARVREQDKRSREVERGRKEKVVDREGRGIRPRSDLYKSDRCESCAVHVHFNYIVAQGSCLSDTHGPQAMIDLFQIASTHLFCLDNRLTLPERVWRQS